jgi:hypothetical protein
MDEGVHDGGIGRRELLRQLGALLLGGLALDVAGAVAAAPRARAAPTGGVLSAQDIALLDEAAEIILPETSTPGARAAGVGAFVALMVKDVLSPAQQAVFREGLATLDARARERTGSSFLAAAPAQRLALLEQLDHEQFEHARTHADDKPAHGFRMLKGLVLFGYFTSEIGYTQALRYVQAPGRFDPAVPRERGAKSWARHASDVGSGGTPGLVNGRRQCRPRAGCGAA